MKAPIRIGINFTRSNGQEVQHPYWTEYSPELSDTEYIRRDVMTDCVKELVYGYTGYFIDDERADILIDEVIGRCSNIVEVKNIQTSIEKEINGREKNDS